MHLLTVFARHGTERYKGADHQYAELLERQLASVSCELIVVDTALPPGIATEGPGRTVIGSANDCWEFSAFDTAMAYVGSRRWQFDLVNFVTSAFGQLYTDYLSCLTLPVLSLAARRPVCLGHIDYSNVPMQLLGRVSQHWVRTSCFFLPPAEVGILGTFISAADRSRWFSGDPHVPFRDDAPLSEKLKQHITGWLTGEDIGQGVTWHSRAILDSTHLSYFEQKALTVINEKLLTLRLAELGCSAIDVTWLASQAAAGVPVDWSASWEAQLAWRQPSAPPGTLGGEADML